MTAPLSSLCFIYVFYSVANHICQLYFLKIRLDSQHVVAVMTWAWFCFKPKRTFNDIFHIFYIFVHPYFTSIIETSFNNVIYNMILKIHFLMDRHSFFFMHLHVQTLFYFFKKPLSIFAWSLTSLTRKDNSLQDCMSIISSKRTMKYISITYWVFFTPLSGYDKT